jgi:sporulation protein YabP
MENQKENYSTVVTLKKRTDLNISGVCDIVSSDESSVCLNTSDGLLVIDGDGLRITSMNVSGGEIVIIGKINSFSYSGKAESQKSGFFARMFK